MKLALLGAEVLADTARVPLHLKTKLYVETSPTDVATLKCDGHGIPSYDRVAILAESHSSTCSVAGCEGHRQG